MFGLGPTEIIVILVIALLLFGPKKMPEIGRSIGQGLRELKKASNDVMSTLEHDYDEPEPEPAREPEPTPTPSPEQKKETL